MTEQYFLETINSENEAVITSQTPDATPIAFTIGELTLDGTALQTTLNGLGADPSDPNTSNYQVAGSCLFTREAGVVSAAIVSGPTVTGPAAVALAWTVSGDACQITLTPLAVPMNHNLEF